MSSGGAAWPLLAEREVAGRRVENRVEGLRRAMDRFPGENKAGDFVAMPAPPPPMTAWQSEKLLAAAMPEAAAEEERPIEEIRLGGARRRGALGVSTRASPPGAGWGLGSPRCGRPAAARLARARRCASPSRLPLAARPPENRRGPKRQSPPAQRALRGPDCRLGARGGGGISRRRCPAPPRPLELRGAEPKVGARRGPFASPACAR